MTNTHDTHTNTAPVVSGNVTPIGRPHAETLPDGGMKVGNGPVPTRDIGLLFGTVATVHAAADQIGLHLDQSEGIEYLTVTGERGRPVVLLQLPSPTLQTSTSTTAPSSSVLDLVLAAVADDLSGSFTFELAPAGAGWQITAATYTDPEGVRNHATV